MNLSTIFTHTVTDAHAVAEHGQDRQHRFQATVMFRDDAGTAAWMTAFVATDGDAIEAVERASAAVRELGFTLCATFIAPPMQQDVALPEQLRRERFMREVAARRAARDAVNA